MTVHEAFAYLRAGDARGMLAFCKAAFGAREGLRLDDPSGRIGHVEMQFGSTTVMLSDAFPEHGILAPEPGTAPRVAIHLHVGDADAVIAQALAAGATLVRPAADHFYGERAGVVRDPFGCCEWIIGHPTETLTAEEMQRRYDALAAPE